MAIFLIIFSFIFIFGIYFLTYKPIEAIFTNIRIAFVKSSLIISLLFVIFTESLSFLNRLAFNHLLYLWSFTLVISLGILLNVLIRKKYFLKNIDFISVLNVFKTEKIRFIIITIFIVIILLTLFFLALTFNNNWDSYTYHLPKVEHWIQNKNVNFYPTNNIRQLYLSPFAEYSILNLRILGGSALFVNLVQFFSLINCLFLTSLITKNLGLSKKWQLLALVLSLAIPMGLLQATTTQTDLVVSFFILSFVYFGMLIIKEKEISINNLLFMGLSFSLGILTKSTFYIFALPFCVFFGIYYLRLFKFKSLYILLSLFLIFIVLNGSFINRNYQQFGSPMGPQKTSSYYLSSLNEEIGIKTIISNSIKNLGLHLSLPNDSWNRGVDKVIVKLHSLIKFPLNSISTSWFGIEYKTNFALHHDSVGNFVQILFLIISIPIVFIKYKSIPLFVKIYFVSIILGILFFACMLKWQPWQTRLDLPLFYLMSPFLAYVIHLIRVKKINSIVCVLLLLISMGILFIYDPLKPIFGKNSVFLKENNSYIFGYSAAKEIESILQKNDISNIGLILGGDSWEWQYWYLSKGRKFESIYFNSDLLKTPNYNENFRYRAVIIDNINLNNPQIKSLIEDKKNILEIFSNDEKTSLVIYKSEQNQIITYK